MVEVLDGETLSSFVLRSGLSDEERKAAEHKLKQTEYTQPAMLTADLAIEHASTPMVTNRIWLLDIHLASMLRSWLQAFSTWTGLYGCSSTWN